MVTMDALGRAWSELRVSDPGALRFRSACRTTLAVAVTGLLFWLLYRAGFGSVLGIAVGVTFALMAASLPREPSPRRRAGTLVAMAASAALAVALTTVAALVPGLGEACFLLLLFGAVAAQTHGPRAIVCGVVVVVNAYLALFLHADPAHVPAALWSLPVALAVVLAAWFHVLPERPGDALVRILGTVRRRAALLLHGLADMTGDRSDHRLRRRRLLADLNETILAAEDQLALLEPEAASVLSNALLGLEVALIRLAVAARAAEPLGRRDRARLRLAALRLHRPGERRRERPRDGANLLGTALHSLEEAAARVRAAAVPAARTLPAGSALPPSAPPRLAWRDATRAGLAALLSMAAGIAISPDRWFWAVLTTFLVFIGARSRGETIFKGAQRVWGTVVGLFVGVLASLALAEHPAAEGAGLLVCVFGLAYASIASPVLAVFFVTVLLGLLYSLVGTGAEEILLLRLEETAIGAAVAIAVGHFVFARRTHEVVHETGGLLVGALARVLREAADRLRGRAGPDPISAMRAADRHFRDLRAALRPLQAPQVLAWWTRREAELPAIIACMFWVRVLAAASEADPTVRDADRLAGRASALAERLDEIAGSSVHHRASPAGDDAAALEVRPAQATDPLTLVALDNLGRAVDVLARRFAADGWDGLIAKRPI